MSSHSITTATWFTLVRLIISPIVLPVLLVYCLPLNNLWLNIALALLFVFFGITDFLDGFIARKYKQESVLGKILDPVADKFLFYSTLIGLLAAGKMAFYWVLILIGREFFIMALRHVALEHHFTISVSWLGKIKTTFTMVTLTAVILNPYHVDIIDNSSLWDGIEFSLLACTTLLSLFSAYRYYKIFMKKWNQLCTSKNNEKNNEVLYTTLLVSKKRI